MKHNLKYFVINYKQLCINNCFDLKCVDKKVILITINGKNPNIEEFRISLSFSEFYYYEISKDEYYLLHSTKNTLIKIGKYYKIL